jgi:hypothetical protein
VITFGNDVIIFGKFACRRSSILNLEQSEREYEADPAGIQHENGKERVVPQLSEGGLLLLLVLVLAERVQTLLNEGAEEGALLTTQLGRLAVLEALVVHPGLGNQRWVIAI